MRRIFHEWGGTIIVVIAVVALIGLVTLLMQPGGVLNGAFGNIVQSFVDKSESLIDMAAVGGAGGENAGSGDSGLAKNEHGFYFGVPYTLTVSQGSQVGKETCILYEDGSAKIAGYLYYDDTLIDEVHEEFPAGTYIYRDHEIVYGDVVYTVNADGTKIIMPDDTFYTLEHGSHE